MRNQEEINKTELAKSSSRGERHYVWASIFAFIAILIAYNLSYGFDSQTFLVAAGFGLASIYLFVPAQFKKFFAPLKILLAPLKALKEKLKEKLAPAGRFVDKIIGKVIVLAIIGALGYWTYNWAAGDGNVGHVPLAQLTLYDIGNLIGGSLILLFLGKMAWWVLISKDE